MSPFWLGYLRMLKNKLGTFSIHWITPLTLSCVCLSLSVFTCHFSIRTPPLRYEPGKLARSDWRPTKMGSHNFLAILYTFVEMPFTFHFFENDWIWASSRLARVIQRKSVLKQNNIYIFWILVLYMNYTFSNSVFSSQFLMRINYFIFLF